MGRCGLGCLVGMVLALSLFVQAASPEAFGRMGGELERYREALVGLRDAQALPEAEADMAAFESALSTAFEVGFRLDKAVETKASEASALRREYLAALRRAERLKSPIDRAYARALDGAMERDDRRMFGRLLKHPLPPLQSSAVRQRIAAYYTPRRGSWKLPRAQALVSELELARESREAYARELQAYQTQFALSIADPAAASEARRLLKRFRNLELYMTQEAEGYGIYAQNDNVYSVTTRIRFLDADNFRFEGNGPYTVELGPGETRKVSTATPQRRHIPASFNISFKMMMGWASARHDASATYRVPFETGRSVLVSQGFNGRVTHKGDSKYAVDFQVPVGTPVVAAREGTVAAVQSAHDKGGFDRSYGSFANYIVIEHPDRTYGQYAHLKKDGVTVRVGQKVKAGERIGYSGNTGYSSGPHLHFEVVKIDASGSAKMVSLPIRFKSGGKLLDAPKPGDRFVAL